MMTTEMFEEAEVAGGHSHQQFCALFACNGRFDDGAAYLHRHDEELDELPTSDAAAFDEGPTAVGKEKQQRAQPLLVRSDALERGLASLALRPAIMVCGAKPPPSPPRRSFFGATNEWRYEVAYTQVLSSIGIKTQCIVLYSVWWSSAALLQDEMVYAFALLRLFKLTRALPRVICFHSSALLVAKGRHAELGPPFARRPASASAATASGECCWVATAADSHDAMVSQMEFWWEVFAKHNFVFVHVPKTAGTSVERVIAGGILGAGTSQHFTARELREMWPSAASISVLHNGTV